MRDLGLFIHDLRHVDFPFRLFYPPEWHRLKPAFTSSALTPIKYWLIIIPFIAGLASTLPISILIEDARITLGNDFQPPFSFLLSYIAAVLYMLAFAIFRLRCPHYVRELDAHFGSLPLQTTQTELVAEMRRAIVQPLNHVLKLKDGKRYTRRSQVYYAEESVPDGTLERLSLEHVEEISSLWDKKSDYTAERILHENGKRIELRSIGDESKLFYKRGEGRSRINIKDEIKMNHDLYMFLFTPELRMRVDSSDKTLHERYAFTSTYLTLSESRSLSRMSVFVLLSISGILGLVVIVQIISRGFALFASLL